MTRQGFATVGMGVLLAGYVLVRDHQVTTRLDALQARGPATAAEPADGPPRVNVVREQVDTEVLATRVADLLAEREREHASPPSPAQVAAPEPLPPQAEAVARANAIVDAAITRGHYGAADANSLHEQLGSVRDPAEAEAILRRLAVAVNTNRLTLDGLHGIP